MQNEVAPACGPEPLFGFVPRVCGRGQLLPLNVAGWTTAADQMPPATARWTTPADGAKRNNIVRCRWCLMSVTAKPVQGRPRRFDGAVGCADCPAMLAALAWRITRYALRAALAQMRQIGIGAGLCRPDPSHTTRHAGPHRAVREVEVRRTLALPGRRSTRCPARATGADCNATSGGCGGPRKWPPPPARPGAAALCTPWVPSSTD